jgi:hypothetical protein
MLGIKPGNLGVAVNGPLALLMETGHKEAVATLVVVADGTTSIYLSNGGGIIGAGSHESVRRASFQLLSSVAGTTNGLALTTDFPLPKRGRVRFYVVYPDGIRTAEASEEDLGYGRHELSSVFLEAHEVITAVRQNTSTGR